MGQPAWPILSPDADFVPVGPWNTDGLIVISPIASPAGSACFQEWREQGFPVVFAGSGEPGPSVIADNEGGIRQALAHLVEHGHRRIAYVAGHEHRTQGDSGRRLRTYQSAVREWGLEQDPRLIAYGSHRTIGGRQATQQILQSGVSFTAVLASNDESALGAMGALEDAGLRVPQDVAVAGFDDLLAAHAHQPSLTTVHYPAFEEGYQALGLVMNEISGQAGSAQVIQVPTYLVVRESCGCLPGGQVHAEQGRDPTQVQKGDGESLGHVRASVVQSMAMAVSTRVPYLDWDSVHQLCQNIVQAFCAHVSKGKGAESFAREVWRELTGIGVQGAELHLWNTVLLELHQRMDCLIDEIPLTVDRSRVEEMLCRAGVLVDGQVWAEHARDRLGRVQIADQVGEMTYLFFTAVEEQEIFEVLAQRLPGIGHHPAVAVSYEPEGSDPVAWSVLQTPYPAGVSRPRFATREFPPAMLYPTDEPLHLLFLPLLVQETLWGFVALDVSYAELAGDIVRQLAGALWEVGLYREAVEGRRLAEEANRLKSRFLSMVSHELRTPLNLISGLSDMLLQQGQQVSPGKYLVGREDVERIYVSAQHLDGLIRDVLDLVRSDLGRLDLTLEPLDLGEMLRPVEAMAAQLAESKGLSWHADIPAGLPQVRGDVVRLRQVVLNLVNNAVKFTSQGSIALYVSADLGRVTVTVQDSGLGIPVDEQQVIFDEFRQSERTAARGYGGMGLGLAISKRLIEAHGGEIWVQSSGKERGGSSFTFALPTVESPGRIPVESMVDSVQRVCVLARSPDTGRALREYLVSQGAQVYVVAVDPGQDWLSSMVDLSPSSVIVDRGLAAECGWEVLQNLQNHPGTRDMPVLFCSLEAGQDSGFAFEVSYLTKPVGFGELARTIKGRGWPGHDVEGTAFRTVLVVDDDPQIVDLHARMIVTHLPECRILKAKNGREALECIQQERPDVVLLDLMMPVLDGFGVLERLQGDPLYRDIAVIVLTGQALTEEDMSRLNRGVDAVLGKGLFTAQETLDVVSKRLTEKRKLVSGTQHAVRRAMAYIHSHYAEPISLSNIAAYAGLSERHLNRSFRQEMSVTAISYLNRYRVRQARTLLRAGEMSITQVAGAVGFSDSNYFARVFRREVGVSPRAYQRSEQ